MSEKKSAGLRRLEEKMQTMEPDSYRYQVLDSCRQFKNSWIDLGQSLFAVQRDKLFREWGFSTFENYCQKELGVKQATAMKLLKSYAFLEKEDPQYIQDAQEKAREGDEPRKFPDVDSVNILRLVKSKEKFSENGYEKLKKKVLEDAVEPQDLRKEIRMMSEREQKDPSEVRADRRVTFFKSTIRGLKDVHREALGSRFLPPTLIEDLEALIDAIEKEALR